jgi:hypothetical protein
VALATSPVELRFPCIAFHAITSIAVTIELCTPSSWGAASGQGEVLDLFFFLLMRACSDGLSFLDLAAVAGAVGPSSSPSEEACR